MSNTLLPVDETLQASSRASRQLKVLNKFRFLNFLHLQHFEYFTKRLSLGKSWNFSVIATTFGKPLAGAIVELKVQKHSRYYSECIHKKVSTLVYFIKFCICFEFTNLMFS